MTHEKKDMAKVYNSIGLSSADVKTYTRPHESLIVAIQNFSKNSEYWDTVPDYLKQKVIGIGRKSNIDLDLSEKYPEPAYDEEAAHELAPAMMN